MVSLKFERKKLVTVGIRLNAFNFPVMVEIYTGYSN